MDVPSPIKNFQKGVILKKFNPDGFHEPQLILYRAGFLDGPEYENLEQFTICGRHRKELGYNWQYLDTFCCLRPESGAYHLQPLTRVGQETVVNLAISRAIYHEKHVVVPIGSGKPIISL